MRSRAVRGLILAVGVCVLAACAYGAGRLLAAEGLDWADKAGSVASAALALVALVTSAMARLWDRVPGRRLVSEREVAQAGDDLAAALGRRWAGEERVRRIHDPRPLPIRWETIDASPAAPGPPAAGHSGSGWYDEALTFFDGLPARRAVFLGPAGAGKSVLAMKLARDLLRTREPGDPVPVILAAGEWDPRVDLGRWLADQLTLGHSGLADQVRLATGETGRLADLLVAGGRVVPVLDGLDELPKALRAVAVEQINDLGSDLPLVVTSRPDEYLDAVGRAGRGVLAATVVELRSLRVADIKAYLREATTATPGDRWDPVMARLDAEPDGPLATALATPLMLWLARTIYEPGEADPAELAPVARFADRAAVEHHLLETFVPAVYAPRTYRAGPARPRYTARQATRWLAYLADDLRRTGTQELAWWRLSFPGIGAPVRMLLLGLLGWFLLVWLLLGYGGWAGDGYTGSVPWRRILLGGPLGRHLGTALDPVVAWLAGHVGGDLTALVDGALRSGTAHLPGVGGWFVILFLASIRTLGNAESGDEPRTLAFAPLSAVRRLLVNATTIVSLDGFGLALHVSLGAGVQTRDRLLRMAWSPANRDLVLLALLVVAVRLPGWVFPRVLVATERHLPGVPRRGVRRWRVEPGSRTDAGLLGPRELLRLDRRADLVNTVLCRLALGTVLALLVAGRLAAAYAILAAAATLMAAVLGGVRRANRRYRDTRHALFLAGDLPLRPMAFLADAYRRGVLRRTGAVYQFRHMRLQEHLAARYPSRSTHLGPALAGLWRRAAPARRAFGAWWKPSRIRRVAVRVSLPARWLVRGTRAIGGAARWLDRWTADSEERDRQRRAAGRAAQRRLIGRLRPGDTPTLTGYQDIDELLDRLRRRLAARLGADLVGLYLHGSLITGDFDRRYSDIDVLAVVGAHPDGPTRRAVDAVLDELNYGLTGATGIDLEWVSVDDLTTGESRGSDSPGGGLPVLPGPGSLLTFACAPRLMRYALRDKGRAVLGPPPRTLVPEVPRPDYAAAFRDHLTAMSAVDYGAAAERDRVAAVRIACRGLRVCQGGGLPDLAPPSWLSVPVALWPHFWPVRAALPRRAVAPEPDVLLRILASARNAVPELAAMGGRADRGVHTRG